MIFATLLAAFALIQCGSLAEKPAAVDKPITLEKLSPIVKPVPDLKSAPEIKPAADAKTAPATKPAAAVKSSPIAEKFQKDGVIPDVIAVAPKELLTIKYSNGIEVNQGNELTPTQVKEQPKVEWHPEPNAYYTLCMTDPDAPSRDKPIRREWHHWLVGNIPGNDIAKGDVLTAYVGSGPPKDTGLHRYVFLLYKQPAKIEFSEQRIDNKTGSKRGQFSIAKFAKKHSLGEPVAGNFYQAKFDDYVPILHKQLKN